MINLNISKKFFFFFKCTPSFYGTHVTCYIKFKLSYKFRILDFFFFPNISIISILLKLKFYDNLLNIYIYIYIIFIVFLGPISLIFNVNFACIFSPKLKRLAQVELNFILFYPKIKEKKNEFLCPKLKK